MYFQKLDWTSCCVYLCAYDTFNSACSAAEITLHTECDFGLSMSWRLSRFLINTNISRVKICLEF